MSIISSWLNIFHPYSIIAQNKMLIFRFLERNIASRYKGSVLGCAWSLVQPLMMLSVYTFVFGVIFKARWDVGDFHGNSAAYPLFMFCGMAVFNIFSESVNSSAFLITGNPGLVKKVVFPLEILPICNVLTSLVYGLAWFFLLFLGVWILLGQISWFVLLIPVVLLPVVLISSGVSMFVSSLGVYLRDVQQFVGIVTQILFFMTPIFYPATVVPEKYKWVLGLNPLATSVDQARDLFLLGRLPDLLSLAFIYCFSLGVFHLGFLWFLRTKKGFADVL